MTTEEINESRGRCSKYAHSYDALMGEYNSLTERMKKTSEAFVAECARYDKAQIELRKCRSEIEFLKREREKMLQQIATLQADIFAKETFWGKIKNLFA